MVLLSAQKVRISTMGYAITKKGQVTIPKHVRDELGVQHGDQVKFVKNDIGEMVVTPEGQYLETLLKASEIARASMTPEFLADFAACDNDGVKYIRWLRGE
jgi:AbrB family looped-hinge helix DNA binding protein